jgi:hypothetical protein
MELALQAVNTQEPSRASIGLRLPTSHFPLPTSHFSLPTSHCPLPTAHFSLPTAHCPLPAIPACKASSTSPGCNPGSAPTETARPVRAVLNRGPATPTPNAQLPATEQHRIEGPSNSANPAPESAPGGHTSHATPNPRPAPPGTPNPQRSPENCPYRANGVRGRPNLAFHARLMDLALQAVNTQEPPHALLGSLTPPIRTSHFSLPTSHRPIHSRHSHSTRTNPTSPLDLIQISPIRRIRPITPCNHKLPPKNSTGSHRRTAHPLRNARRVNSHMEPACRQHHRSIHTPANSVLLCQ